MGANIVTLGNKIDWNQLKIIMILIPATKILVSGAVYLLRYLIFATQKLRFHG